MTDDKKPCDDKPVYCHRLDKKLLVREHAECPYCFGKKGEIAPGKHPEFCDFRPGVDPVHFGFPCDTSRDLQG